MHVCVCVFVCACSHHLLSWLTQSVSDLDFWFGEVEAQLSSGDTGRDLGGVQALLKKHRLVEADITAHQVHTATP